MISRLCDVIIWGAGLVALALLVCFALVNWPVAFALVGGGLCVLAMIVMLVQIATGGPRPEPTDLRVSATVDGVPVKNVEVLG